MVKMALIRRENRVIAWCSTETSSVRKVRPLSPPGAVGDPSANEEDRDLRPVSAKVAAMLPLKPLKDSERLRLFPVLVEPFADSLSSASFNAAAAYAA
jgi:hypothetical protein